MGGGRSKQSSSNTTYDNDIVAGEGAIAVGNGSQLALDQSRTEVDYNTDFESNFEQRGGDVDGGVGVTGDGNSVSGNFGTMIGQDSLLNNGLYVGENSQFSTTSMDENTANMLNSALALIGHNADNFMKMAADSDSRAARIQYITPTTTTTGRGESLDAKRVGIVVVALAVLGLVIHVLKSKGGKK